MVSGDEHRFSLRESTGIKIVTVAEMLELLSQEIEEASNLAKAIFEHITEM